jgi:hypothetical protein
MTGFRGVPLLAFLAPCAYGGGFLVDGRASLGAYDFQLGLRAGAEAAWGGGLWAGFLDLEGRAFPRKTRIRETPNLSYQYRENRYSIGPGFTAAYPLFSSLHLTGGSGAFYTFADFRGSSRTPRHEWSGWMEAGLRVPAAQGYWWQFLYQHHSLPYMPPHRVAVQLGMRFQ